MWKNWIVQMLFGLAVVLLVVYSLNILLSQKDNRFRPIRQISLKEIADKTSEKALSHKTGATTIRVAVAPVISPESSLRMYQEFVDYLALQLDRKGFLILRNSYAEINNLIRQRECDLALICTYPFVQGERDFGLQVIAVPQINNKTTYQALIVVPADSTAKTLLDLQGKHFGSSDHLSTSGWLYPAVWLLNHGKDPEHFFYEHILTGSHDKSVNALIKGYVDAVSVHSVVYEQMARTDKNIRENTRVIMISEDYGMPPVVVHPKTDPQLKKRIQDIMLSMHTSEEGKAVLAKLGIDRYVLAEPTLHDSVRKAAQTWETKQ